MTVLLASLAGGVGAVTRFVVDSLVGRHNRFQLPLGTLLVNVTGSLLLGLVVGWATHASAGDAVTVRTILGTGFCGGYTTFSTASVEGVRLWLAEGSGRAVTHAVVMLVGSVLAAALGLALGAGLGG